MNPKGAAVHAVVVCRWGVICTALERGVWAVARLYISRMQNAEERRWEGASANDVYQGAAVEGPREHGAPFRDGMGQERIKQARYMV